MTDFTVWETAPFNSTIDHILQRYHNVHRAQFEELVPLAQKVAQVHADTFPCLLYTSPSPRDVEESRMPSSA